MTFSTDQMVQSVEICRLSWGGHGISQASGLPKIYVYTCPPVRMRGRHSVVPAVWKVNTSSHDYNNSLLYNAANKDIGKLQSVQNCLARVVTRSSHFSRSVTLLKSLDSIPVHYRIIFKIYTITYHALSSTQPAYLNLILTPARNSRQLRSIGSNPIDIPRVKTKAGTRAFSVAAPIL